MSKHFEITKKSASRRKFIGDVAKGLSVAALGAHLELPAMGRSPLSLSNELSRAGAKGVGFVIHGGAGTIVRGKMTREMEESYRVMLTQALTTGYDILKRNGSGLDAVEAALKIMEDSPLFNAGKGAVFTNAGTNELDASIMDGKTLKAGAVSNLKHIKNPISLARLVMERSPHVMMVGDGAETFATQQGMKLMPQEYFYTERRWKELQQEKEEEKKAKEPTKKSQHAELPQPMQHSELFKRTPHDGLRESLREPHTPFVGDKHGTVGAAALDSEGNLAAGTSTGGLSNKKFGRVGDSPIIGAGTYANNLTCAISATGDGEYFIRSVVAHDISALMEYRGMPLKEAAQTVINKVGKLGGTGGVIGIDKDGNTAMVFNTEGMYRGYMDASGKPVVEIYKES
jgi:beta-aspartyl-peptidase (threonine type)